MGSRADLTRHQWLKALLLTCVVGSTSGCLSGFDQRHYFRSVDQQGRTVNYYKVEVFGGTFLSSSRYLSTYCDPATLDAYFDTFSQPSNGSLSQAGKEGTPSQPSGSAPADTGKATNLQPLASDEQGKQLVLLLSSNSDAIAQGLGALAQSGQAASALAGIVTAGRNQAASAESDDAILGAARGTSIKAYADAQLKDIASSTPADTYERLLTLANALADTLGPHAAFSNVTDVERWLAQQSAKESK